MDKLSQSELSLLEFIAEHMHSGVLDYLMPIVSGLGDLGIFWIVLALVLLSLPQDRARGAQVGLAVLLSGIVCNLLLKNLVARPRPFEFQPLLDLIVAAPHDFSFPSGHTTASFAAATVLMLSGWKAAPVAVLVAVLIAFSRLYLNVHFPTDVLAGVLTGVALGFVTTKLYSLVAGRQKRIKGG